MQNRGVDCGIYRMMQLEALVFKEMFDSDHEIEPRVDGGGLVATSLCQVGRKDVANRN